MFVLPGEIEARFADVKCQTVNVEINHFSIFDCCVTEKDKRKSNWIKA